MLSINWSDVWKMVESIKVPLIVIGVALALAIIVSLAVFKLSLIHISEPTRPY